MSEVLLLFDVERENTVCSLFGVNTASSLKALRAAVTDQVSELIPEHFLFARDATQQIPKSAEDFLIINSITSRDSVGNLTVKFSDISSYSSDKEAATESGNFVSNDGTKFSDNCSQQECFERNRDKTSVNQALKSPTSWSIRGVKGELHLKIWSIRMKMSKCLKHHDRIPKHVFYQLVKSLFKFPYFLRKKIDFRERM
ncbi:Hypothetical predicted protein [Paramuricea clavata]|uniref:Uncharacterized protein n=1 Tax=Paramuricea clavata TaxID=317549 RepID=A0A7D9I4S5_PARCT|nr:Hypothetical predicted protein [Paramuricea clavata]